MERRECKECHRVFNAVPYERHVLICEQVFGNKRKKFMSERTLQGTHFSNENPPTELTRMPSTCGKMEQDM